MISSLQIAIDGFGLLIFGTAVVSIMSVILVTSITTLLISLMVFYQPARSENMKQTIFNLDGSRIRIDFDFLPHRWRLRSTPYGHDYSYSDIGCISYGGIVNYNSVFSYDGVLPTCTI